MLSNITTSSRLCPLVIAVLLCATGWGVAPTQACTGIALVAKDKSVAVGRTLEFAQDTKSSVVVYPAGYEFTGVTPKGDGVKWKSKYGIAGMDMFDQEGILIDGLNEKGLNVGGFYFAGWASYPEATAENMKNGISPTQYVTWLLSNFATVEEVKANYDKVTLLPVKMAALGIVPPVHFKVQDATGACVTIEPVEETLKIYDNPVGALTNTPDFPWMLTYLDNFASMSAQWPPTREINGAKFPAFDMGAGMVGLPGDFTAPSRFVRIVLFAQYLPEQPDSPTAAAAIFYLLSNFDIPLGSSLPQDATTKSIPDYTPWTAVSDLKNLTYNWRTIQNPTLKMVDLTKALAKIKDGKPLTVEIGSQAPKFVPTFTDVTANLK